MSRIVVAVLFAMSAVFISGTSAFSDSVTGCDGKKYDLPKPKSNAECMANGVILKCSVDQSKQYCSQHYPK